MDVQAIGLGYEIREAVPPRLARAPIIFGSPIARELLHCRQLHALRCIGDRFPFRPLGCVYSPAQVGKFPVRNIYAERTNRILIGCLVAAFCSNGFGHDVSSGGGHGYCSFSSVMDGSLFIARVEKGRRKQSACMHAPSLRRTRVRRVSGRSRSVSVDKERLRMQQSRSRRSVGYHRRVGGALKGDAVARRLCLTAGSRVAECVMSLAGGALVPSCNARS